MDQVLDDWRSAPVRAEVKGALGFLETLVKTGEVTADDVRAAYATGVTRDMLERAVVICCAFTIIVRMADTFEFAVPPAEAFASDARMLMKRGYIL